jgi:NADPH-dependent 2,4-dienoyl-CoA reductase/sulfur reductase-like enzyme
VHDVCVGAGGEAGVGVAEVLGDLGERAAFVEEQRGAGVAEVVAAKVTRRHRPA